MKHSTIITTSLLCFGFPTFCLGAELMCQGKTAVYGQVRSITIDEANGMNAGSLALHAFDSGVPSEVSAVLEKKTASEEIYLTKGGVQILIPSQFLSDSRPSVQVKIQNGKLVDSVTCQLD